MRKYSITGIRWLENILQERFGHSFELVEQPNTLKLSLPGSQGSITFDQLQPVFNQSRSDFPCQHWQASTEDYQAPIEDSIPAPSETELQVPLVEVNEQGAIIHYDILGLTYWMLTRLEEIGRTDLDEHQRFPAASSHAYKHGYLQRPIVDEWLIILGQVIEQVWPELQLKRHEFSIEISHDVDSPSQYAFKTWPTIGRMMASHLLRRRSLKEFFSAPYIKLATGKKLHSADAFNTFDWLMDVSETNNLRSAFYFICGRTSPAHDSDYELENPIIRNLLRRIHERGHEIGLHPSYGTFQSPELVKQEADRLKRVCFEEGIEQARWGGRMHYLRWEQPTTLRAWADAGMNYDSTLGYADRPGFRCGTCHEYPGFNPVSERITSLRIRPLIVMEGSVIGAKYQAHGLSDAALRVILKLKSHCSAVNGTFSLLWHNSFLLSDRHYKLYESCLSDSFYDYF